jgi:hypothetical protein
LQEGKKFYTDLIQQGDWAVLAVAVSKNEISVDELYKRLTEQEREKLKMQIDLLNVLRADNAKDEAQDYEAAKILMRAVVGKVTQKSQGALPTEEPKPQLPAGATAEDKHSNETP